jgi:subtilase family serine protease
MSAQLERLLRGAMAVGLVASSLAVASLISASPADGRPGGAGPLVRLAKTAPPAVPAGARLIGPLAAGRRIRLDVTLTLPDPGAVASYVAALSDPHSPLFHRFLRGGQFGLRFGPSQATVATVESALRAAGLEPGTVAGDHLAIPVVATAGAVERAFHISLVDYQLPDGRIAYANSTTAEVPADIAPVLGGVLGLDDLYTVQSRLVRS